MMAKAKKRGLLIVFEGTDGTGKSTQARLLYRDLVEKGYPVIETREPTAGVYGQKIRLLYQHRDTCSREEELELFLADRREHVRQLIAPALAEGKIILCDRYFLSTAAYQGARGIVPETILQMNRFAPDPDLALLFQANLNTGLQRITEGRGERLNDFEQKNDLHQVAAIFASIKRPYIRIIDADGSIEEVHRQVQECVRPLLSAFSADQE